MPEIRVSDVKSVLGVRPTLDLAFSRALTLLAIATSPSPRSRYRPSARWTIAKYWTACDPRRIRGGGSTFIVNPGIQDLDPHQKNVLADDMGMALSLGVLDELYGIAGIADVYSWEASGILKLNKKGKHRKMPDFVLKLRTPITGSRIVLLECKGSTSRGRSTSQLDTACRDQLKNVSTVAGVTGAAVPKIAAATEFRSGTQPIVRLDDPPEEIGPLGDRLEANFLALEYSLFGDLRTANAVWKKYELPTYVTPSSGAVLPDQLSTEMDDESVTALVKPDKLKTPAENEFERNAAERIGYAHTHVRLEMSDTARAARENQSWDSALSMRESSREAPGRPSKDMDIEEHSAQRRRMRETGITDSGVRCTTTVTAWLE